MKSRVVTVAALALMLLAVTGCSTVAEDAETGCLSATSSVSDFNKAPAPGGEISEIISRSATSVVDRGNSGLAHEVLGTAEVRVGESSRTVDWECFSQVVNGKRYSELVRWG